MVRKTLCLASALVLSSCASSKPPDQSAQLAQVPIIIAALKCAFATALVKESKGPPELIRLDGRTAAGTLTLKLVHTTGTDLGAKAIAPANPLSGPLVFALGGGAGSVMPSISKGVKRTDTISTEVPFRIFMSAGNTDACNDLSESQNAKLGFSEWLAALITGLDANARYEPIGEIDAIKFSQDFAVVNTTKGGIDFNFVFVAANAGRFSESNDIQNLTFTIAPTGPGNKAPKNAG